MLSETTSFPESGPKPRNAQDARKATARRWDQGFARWMEGSKAPGPFVLARSTENRLCASRLALAPKGACAVAAMVLLLFLASFHPAGAAMVTNLVTPSPMAPMPEVGSSVIRIIGALALVIGLFFGGMWLSRNWSRVVSRPVRSPDLKVIECKGMGGRQALWVVGYRQQRLLLASSPAGIVLLTPLPEETASEPVVQPPMDFAEAFRQVLGRRS